MRKAVKTTSTNTASKTEWIKGKSAEWSEKEAHHSPLSQVTVHKKQIIWSQKNHTVLNNVGNTANKWAAETSTFNRKYEQDPTQQGVYKPKGGPMNAAQINEPISFTAPWGEKMNIDKGGYILQDPNNPNDIYGISGKDFDSTYRFNENRNYLNLNETQLNKIIEESIRNAIRKY